MVNSKDSVTKSLDCIVENIGKHLKENNGVCDNATMQNDLIDLSLEIYNTTKLITDGTVGVITHRITAAQSLQKALQILISNPIEKTNRLVE